MPKRIPVRIPESTKEWIKMFENESDRASAVLGGAYLEEILDRVLRGCLITDEHIERHFNNASQKVHLLFALGVVDGQEREELLTIQKVRNFFAHHVLDANDFNNSAIAGLIDRVGKSMGASRRFGPAERREVFLIAVMGLGQLMTDRVLRNRSDAAKRAEAQARHRAVNSHSRVMRFVEGL